MTGTFDVLVLFLIHFVFVVYISSKLNLPGLAVSFLADSVSFAPHRAAIHGCVLSVLTTSSVVPKCAVENFKSPAVLRTKLDQRGRFQIVP